MNKSEMTIQSKLILSGLIISTLFIIGIAIYATFRIQSRLNEGYENFGRIISKTLAVETVDIIKDTPKDNLYLSLKDHSGKILDNNNDIVFIEFFDNDGNIIYSSKDDYTKPSKSGTITINSPMVSGLSEKKNNRLRICRVIRKHHFKNNKYNKNVTYISIFNGLGFIRPRYPHKLIPHNKRTPYS